MEVSADLKTWKAIDISRDGRDNFIVTGFSEDEAIRYLRIDDSPDRLAEIQAYKNSAKLDRSNWRASNLFGPYAKAPAEAAWSLSFVLDEAAKNSYLAIAINGRHGKEAAYAGLRVDGELVGAPDRSLSYASNVWEYCSAETDSDYTYYFPVTKQMLNRKIDAVVLMLKGGSSDIKPQIWITAYPAPFESKQLVLKTADTQN